MQNFRIFIPTLGRIDKQITYDNMTNDIRAITTIVIQPHEELAFREKYPSANLLVLDENIKGIANTRKFIIEYSKKKYSKIAMLDDDLIFNMRNIDRVTLKKPHDEKSRIKFDNFLWIEFIEYMVAHLENYAAIGCNNDGAFPSSSEILEFRKFAACTFIKIDEIEDINFDWSVKFGEDMWFLLQCCMNGKKIAVTDKFLYKTKSFAEGGCKSEGRDETINNDSHDYLCSITSFAKNTGKTKLYKNGDSHFTMNMIKYEFKKAYDSYKNVKLF